MNRAMDGDTVVIEMLPESQWSVQQQETLAEQDDVDNAPSAGDAGAGGDGSATAPLVQRIAVQAASGKNGKPCGKVVGILKRNWRPYAGSVDMGTARAQTALFVAYDQKIPKIRVSTRQAEALRGKRIIVTIDKWEHTSWYPEGHYVRIIGDVGNKDVETDVILHEYEVITRDFSAAVLRCLPPLPWSISEEELARRADFRELPVCSIDPPGCKDIDDALHIRQLGPDRFEAGVHIADVTHFLKPDTPMDLEAAARATSVYLVQRRLDMLPGLLTTDICSLNHKVDRLTFSCVWELTGDGDILSTKFTKAVIHSRCAFSYQQAQACIDNPADQSPLTTGLRQLNALAKALRRKRVSKGALTLASPEVRFQLDTETHNPIDVGMYEHKETNALVEVRSSIARRARYNVIQHATGHFPCNIRCTP